MEPTQLWFCSAALSCSTIIIKYYFVPPCLHVFWIHLGFVCCRSTIGSRCSCPLELSFSLVNMHPAVTSIIAGALFAVGWWLVVDAGAYANYSNNPQKVEFVYLLPNLFITFAIIMLNGFKWEDLTGEGFSETNATRAKCCMFSGLFICFTCVAGSVWIMIEKYSQSTSIANDAYPGVALFISSLLLFLSAVVLRAGNMSSD